MIRSLGAQPRKLVMNEGLHNRRSSDRPLSRDEKRALLKKAIQSDRPLSPEELKLVEELSLLRERDETIGN